MSASPLSKQPKKTAKTSVKPKKVSSKKNTLITLEDYLASKRDSKRRKKRFARAVKFYKHSSETMTHANADFRYTKEAWLCLLQAAEHIMQESQHSLDTWQESLATAAQKEISAKKDTVEEEFSAEELLPQEHAKELEMHLRQVSKDIYAVLHDTESAGDDLHRAEEFLMDIIAMAKEDNLILNFEEAKAFVMKKAKGGAIPKKAKRPE